MRLNDANQHDSREIVALANHHKEILDRKFPDYRHVVTCAWGQDCLLRAKVSVGDRCVLKATFTSNSVHISSFGSNDVFILDYADPKFTDDAISDKLDRLVKMWALARHHKEILEHRFPHFNYAFYESATVAVPFCLHIEVHNGYRTVLKASFSADSVRIAPYSEDDIDLNYADPEFTDNVISYVLEEWEVEHASPF